MIGPPLRNRSNSSGGPRTQCSRLFLPFPLVVSTTFEFPVRPCSDNHLLEWSKYDCKYNKFRILNVHDTHAGVVLRIPYLHVPAYFSDKLIDSSTGRAARPEQYELIAAITRLRAHTFGEDFHQFMEEGASQRVCAVCYLDIFCYQPPDKRPR